MSTDSEKKFKIVPIWLFLFRQKDCFDIYGKGISLSHAVKKI